jgi:hypothetical protein
MKAGRVSEIASLVCCLAGVSEGAEAIATKQPAGHRIKVWFDDVVVATEYIGPIRSGG